MSLEKIFESPSYDDKVKTNRDLDLDNLVMPIGFYERFEICQRRDAHKSPCDDKHPF